MTRGIPPGKAGACLTHAYSLSAPGAERAGVRWGIPERRPTPHLTLPRLRRGPLPLRPEGRRGLSARVAGVGGEAGALDAVHGAGFVLVRGVTADPDRADDFAARVADQHTARDRHDAAARGRHPRLQEPRA